MDQILPFDWQRLILGDAPPLFLLEILFRTLIIWLWTALLLRWVGGRSIAQLSIVEFLLVIALGSAVGDSLFYPEVPLAHAMLVILAVVLLDKAVDHAIRRWRPVKRVVDGVPAEVVRDGRILCESMVARQIGTSELMERLRLNGIDNLGSIRRAYLEPSGALSLFRADPARPGLPIEPPVEITDLPPPARGAACCVNCGFVASRAPETCPECGIGRWTRPVMPAAP